MILILVLITLFIAFYFLNLNYKYWEKRGVPGPTPKFLVGNLLDNFLLKKSLAEVYADVYKQFQNAPMVGMFRAITPSLVIRDPELIREITVKSFQNFHDNELFLDKNVDALSGRNPFFLRGEEWKTTRMHLTPGFTSGKMKAVYPLLEEVSRNLVKFLSKLPPTDGHNVKEVCMRFTLNNVGSCAFGLDAKCFEEENPEFKQIGDRFVSPEGFQSVKVFLISIIPALAKIISIRFTPIDVEKKLFSLITETLRYREENNIVRNDFLHIMHQLMKSNPEFTEVDVTAHCAGFFGDGYETSSIAMHYILYELAAKKQAQAKLREEIDRAFDENDDTLPYEELQKLSYLDAVLNESLRLHPPLATLNKVCTKPYTYIPKEGDVIEKPVIIEPDTLVILTLYGLQRDSKYFKNPDSFIPERFLERSNVPKYSFLPFGEGPRACLGQRFGILQVKIGVAYVIRNFELAVNEKTQLPIRMSPMYFLNLPKEPLYLDFKRIIN